jgi:glycosyltransferase involved in cell wall biosynthesis
VRVSVVIPSLNEEDNLAYVFERMPREVHEVVLVDGHSTDHTIEVARRLPPGLQRARAERLVYHRRDHRQAEAGKP